MSASVLYSDGYGNYYPDESDARLNALYLDLLYGFMDARGGKAINIEDLKWVIMSMIAADAVAAGLIANRLKGRATLVAVG